MKLASRRNVLGAAFLLAATGAYAMSASAPFGFWQAVGSATGARDDLDPIDFNALERRSSPNDALVCPVGVCPKARADAVAVARYFEYYGAAADKLRVSAPHFT